MGRKKKCKSHGCPPSEKWAVPTADFFSLLLALFIALYAIASTNKEKMKAVKEEFVKIYDFAAVPEAITPVVDMVTESKPTVEATSDSSKDVESAGGESPLVGTPSDATAEPTSDVVEKIQKELKNASMSGSPLDQAVDGVLLRLPATVPFSETSASINSPEIKLFIRRVAEIINTLPASVDISVRGYTDNHSSSKDTMYMSNIDLSNKRADVVIRELIANGVSPERLSSAGFGSSKPFAQNNTEENRAKNRRVEFFMFVSNDTPLNKEKQKSVLDALSGLKPKE